MRVSDRDPLQFDDFSAFAVNVRGRMDHPEEMDCSGLHVAGTDPAPARGTPAVLRPCAGCLWAPDAELMHQQRRGFSTFKLILRTGRHCRSMCLMLWRPASASF
jgi:hypothetical protein